MPLKHATETLLVFILAVTLLLTGVVLRLLPELPGGLLWWSVAFVIALLYPLVLYPLMRKRRADYSLRALHFLPALFLLLWLVLMLAGSWLGVVGRLLLALRWGLGLLPVTFGLVLLALYCMHVIRQRGTRLPLLLLLFVPFALLGTTVETGTWNGLLASSSQSSSRQQANLEPSDNTSENQWRGILRRMERREQRIAEQDDPFASSAAISSQSSSAPVMIAVTSSVRSSQGRVSTSSSQNSSRQMVDAPPNLVSSGPVLNMLGVLFVAAYCAVLQSRAMKRKDEL